MRGKGAHLDETIFWLWFSKINCQNQTKIKLIKDFKNPKVIWNLKQTQLEHKRYSENDIQEIINGKNKIRFR